MLHYKYKKTISNPVSQGATAAAAFAPKRKGGTGHTNIVGFTAEFKPLVICQILPNTAPLTKL